MPKEILVAGGTGLVGANLTFKLQDLGIPVVATRHSNQRKTFLENCLKYDFRIFEDCFEATKNKNAVVLCAGQSFGAKENRENPTGSILPNLQICCGLLEACARNGVQTVVLLSSTTVYQPALYPIREDELNLNIHPFAGYFGVGWTNRYLEKLAEFYSINYNMRVVILRPTSIYGPYDKFDEEKSHVVPALIKRAFDKEDPFVVWGNHNVVRDFIYVEDVVSDIMFALMNESVPGGDPINICSGTPMSISSIVDIVLKVCGHTPEVLFNSDKPSAIPYRAVNDNKYHCFFNKVKRTPFETGVKKTAEWFKTTLKEK